MFDAKNLNKMSMYMYLYTNVNSFWHRLKVSINFSMLLSFFVNTFFTIADLLSACPDIHSLNHEKPISVVFVALFDQHEMNCLCWQEVG